MSFCQKLTSEFYIFVLNIQKTVRLFGEFIYFMGKNALKYIKNGDIIAVWKKKRYLQTI